MEQKQQKKGGIKGLTLTIEGQPAVDVSQLEQLKTAVDQLSPDGGPGFIILEGPGQDYTQATGGNGVYTAEWRKYSGDKFWHWVAGLPDLPSKKKVVIPTNGFQVTVRENERLGASDVKTILVSFAKGKGRLNQFVWRETTKNYPKVLPKQKILSSPDLRSKVKIIDDEPEDGCFAIPNPHRPRLKKTALKKVSEVNKSDMSTSLRSKDDFESWNDKGVDLLRFRKYKQALKAFNEALKIDSHSAIAWSNKGVSLNGLREYGEAIKSFDKAIKLGSTYAETLYCKGVALTTFGLYDEALKTSDVAILLDPNDAEVWYDRSCIYALKGRKSTALKLLLKAVRMDPKWKDWAKKDEDFRNLWNTPMFWMIVEEGKNYTEKELEYITRFICKQTSLTKEDHELYKKFILRCSRVKDRKGKQGEKL